MINPKQELEKITGGRHADFVEMEGVIIEEQNDGSFKVQLDNGRIISAHTSSRIKTNRIRLFVNDKVTVQLSPYDLGRGRITWRSK